MESESDCIDYVKSLTILREAASLCGLYSFRNLDQYDNIDSLTVTVFKTIHSSVLSLLFLIHGIYELYIFVESFLYHEIPLVKIDIFPQLLSDLFTSIVLVYYLISFRKIKETFLEWITFQNKKVHSYPFSTKVNKKFVYLIYILYGGLVFSSSFVACYIFLQSPNSPYFITSYFTISKGSFSYYLVAIFYTLKEAVATVVCAFVEITTCFSSHRLKSNFKRLRIWLRKDIKKILNASSTIKQANASNCNGSSHQINVVQSSDEAAQLNEISKTALTEHAYLCKTTTFVKGIFGPVLFLDLSAAMISVIATIYSSIKNLYFVMSPNQTTSIFVTNVLNEISFIFWSLNYLIRLIVIISICSKVNIEANRIGDVFAEMVQYFPKAVLTKVAVFLQRLDGFPVAVSAGGFFNITLYTYLAFISSVITYLVVLLKY